MAASRIMRPPTFTDTLGHLASSVIAAFQAAKTSSFLPA